MLKIVSTGSGTAVAVIFGSSDQVVKIAA